MAKVDYEAVTAELAALVADLETGTLSVEAAVTCYARGLVIVDQLKQQLESAENRVRELKVPFEAEITDDEE